MERFLALQRRLLSLEHDAELQENQALRGNSSPKELETMGLCIRTLKPEKVKSGLAGRILVTLCKENGDLPHTKLSSGDIVGVFTRDLLNPECSGVIYSVRKTKLVVACDEFTLQDAICNVVMLANDVTHKRQMQVLDAIEHLQPSSPAYRLMGVLLGEEQARVNDTQKPLPPLFNPRLNARQSEAVHFATVRCTDISIIHGPPGTGKTTTLVEVILQLVARGEKVLATAPSNIAVDNILEQLAGKVPVVRLGHPARILAHLEEYSLDRLVKRSDQSQLVLSVNKDISRVNDLLLKARGGERSELRMQLRDLRKEAKQRSAKAIAEVFTQSRVILATNIGAGDKGLQRFIESTEYFDTVLIDEAAQALEASCWIPVLKGKKLILAGDHKQLPPTIKSQDAQSGLSQTLMARLCESCAHAVMMLEEQYRMNEAIMRWPSTQFYEGRLTAHESVRNWTIPCSEGPLLFIDTTGCEMRDSGSALESKYNIGEASVVAVVLEEMKQLGVTNMGVITPYSAQVEVLLSLSLTCEVSTVDGFQGREKDVIVISLVRSNTAREVGFLADERRLNVAITRARKLLCIIGDSDTLGSNKSTECLRSFVRHLHEHAVVRGVQSYYQHDPRIVLNQGSLQPIPTKVKSSKPPAKVKGNRPPPPAPSEQPKGDPFALAESLIQEFLQDEDSSELVLDPAPGNIREQIHRLCEGLGLEHMSRGSGNSRCVVVRKPIESEEQAAADDSPSEEVVPAPTQPQPPKAKKQKAKKVEKSEPVKLTEEEELKFLDELVEASTHCQFPGCKESLHAISVACRYCGRPFCLSHTHAEAHGCGPEACRKARATLTAAKPSHLKPTERTVLLNRLHQKQAEARPVPKKKKK